MKYISTRGENLGVTASQAILKGIANDGGLYVPEKIPLIDKPLSALMNLSYQELAFEILKPYLTDYSDGEITSCIQNAYDAKFDDPMIAPIKESHGNYFLELYHGPTLAFKDMALSILPHFMTLAAKKNNMDKKITILTATSGDTGKAAIDGFANVDNMNIIVFYPQDGVSKIQKLQMVTQEGDNVSVCAVKGNFDDCQNAVKKMFSDPEFNKELSQLGYVLSSANSINIGRLLPQVVYYFYGYLRLMERGVITEGSPINFTVPTGNFGNILAGFYAKNMGLPINKLICASNNNKVLYDFFKTGVYDKNREFLLTMSPSMDILISSNLERLLYHLSHDPQKVSALMSELSVTGRYSFDLSAKEFAGEYASEDETTSAIKKSYNNGYIIDTHTAVAFGGYEKYVKNTGDKTPNIIVSTASPYKFAQSVHKCINEHNNKEIDEVALLPILANLGSMPIPLQIKDLDKKPVLHHETCTPQETFSYVKTVLTR